MRTRPIRRALISVWDKTGLDELVVALSDAGVDIVSTGSTSQKIAEAGVPVTQVADLTGFPECLDGRVKTLHPRVHAGILADRRRADHERQLEDLGVEPFDLVVVNLYPFAETVASGADVDDCIEQIDIGGPSMVRAAAKNHPSVAVVVSPSRYPEVIEAVREGGFTEDQRRMLATEAFRATAEYDVAVASWMGEVLASGGSEGGFPPWIGGAWERAEVLRYGENPHQRAALYVDQRAVPGLAQADQLSGKPMSYNNFVDADSARRVAYDFDEPAIAIIKHSNPCGVATGSDIADAHRKAHETDPISAFGGVIAANREVSPELAGQISEIFTEVVIAPAFHPEALALLTKKANLRLLRCEPVGRGEAMESRMITGGLLLQTVDHLDDPGDDPADWQLVAGQPVSEAVLADLVFAWRACRGVKSNAILLAHDTAAVGIGMGQVNRVDSARLAVLRAGEDRVRTAVAASDAFFPFPDGVEVLLEAGVRAIVQPGGSVRDAEVVATVNAVGATMYFTGTRHFFH
ncbi:MAG: bifunctional phosphoribosylaminoimidazolecarboxamide formyltransferase/IMP cyclohydrolase [Candidatus Nanopelagicales bacterium]|nr:bifunctional phosphoribosylaminoimidazolecarboxamide formyltransferase/IMP cyclohydrolase [Candidatus Nanopelagicales bacterium]